MSECIIGKSRSGRNRRGKKSLTFGVVFAAFRARDDKFLDAREREREREREAVNDDHNSNGASLLFLLRR